MTDLRVRIGALTLANPVMPASGTFAEGLAQEADLNRLGALLTKTITRELREGNPLPRCARRVRVPVIGCGGILAEDAAENMLAAATAVQVGTATFLHPGAMIEIIDGLAAFCAGRNIRRVAELTGAMQREEADEAEVEWMGVAQ